MAVAAETITTSALAARAGSFHHPAL